MTRRQPQVGVDLFRKQATAVTGCSHWQKAASTHDNTAVDYEWQEPSRRDYGYLMQLILISARNALDWVSRSGY